MRNVNIETLDDFNRYNISMFSNVIKVFWKDFGKYRTINLPRRHCLRFSEAFHPDRRDPRAQPRNNFDPM